MEHFYKNKFIEKIVLKNDLSKHSGEFTQNSEYFFKKSIYEIGHEPYLYYFYGDDVDYDETSEYYYDEDDEKWFEKPNIKFCYYDISKDILSNSIVFSKFYNCNVANELKLSYIESINLLYDVGRIEYKKCRNNHMEDELEIDIKKIIENEFNIIKQIYNSFSFLTVDLEFFHFKTTDFLFSDQVFEFNKIMKQFLEESPNQIIKKPTLNFEQYIENLRINENTKKGKKKMRPIS